MSMRRSTVSATTATPEQSIPSMPPRRRGSIRHFNGTQKSTNEWDGLRKDTELWFEDGDCSVHLYTLGGSQRGPSLRLRYADVEALRCDYLTDQCLYICESPNSSPIDMDDGASDSGYASSQITKRTSEQCELYIPAPADAKREQAYTYHLTTRNFFAYATKKPVVGEKLGSALADLLERMREWQPKTAALANFMSYCEEQGYLNMAGNADYALACLALAEDARLKDLWVESFVHCVGMFEKLHVSPEFEGLSNTTRALITRATLEMDLHIARVTRAVGSFLEEELGPENLGLTKPARDHLDQFRSFLHKYYVTKLGYFPPSEEGPWNKRLWTKMYHAFQTLYEYLVDNDSSIDRLNDRGVTGGICVVQNVQAFDERHGYTPLPHPLPLLPADPGKRRATDAQKGLRSFMLGRGDSLAAQQMTSRQALTNAANRAVQEATPSDLVEEYQRFERQKLEEKLTVAEARKVRWLLIYGVLQMLISITRAPKEVRDTEAPTYPLCVLTLGGPSWINEASPERTKSLPLRRPDAASAMLPQVQPETEPEADGRLSIHPDCEAETAEDYFSGNTISRRASELSFDLTPSPLRITTQISKTASIRSSVHSGVHALHKSFIGGMSRRNSLRRTVTARPVTKNESGGFCEIMVAGYGNGTDAEEGPARSESLLSIVETPRDEYASLAAFDFGLNEVNEEPVLEDFQVDHILQGDVKPDHALTGLERSPSDGSLSMMSTNRSSNRSSMLYMAEYDSPATDYSPWESDESKRNSEIADGEAEAEMASPAVRPALGSTRHSYQQKELNFGVNMGLRNKSFTVTAGCYTPTGSISLPKSKFYQQRAQSVASTESSTSSTYPDDSMQASEIEEEESRGRRRVRALDRVSLDEMEAQGRALCLDA
ncbi:hypothetical protein LTR27_011241 [Elasticomyces elasticus]|nr:hypothetical protein LTR27_011241 [Elasticomyces elasticus]